LEQQLELELMHTLAIAQEEATSSAYTQMQLDMTQAIGLIHCKTQASVDSALSTLETKLSQLVITQ